MDQAFYGYRGSPRFWKDAVSEAAKDLGLKPSMKDNSLYMDPGNFIQCAHVDDELLSWDDQLVRDMVRKLKQKVLGEESTLDGQGWRHKRVDTLTKASRTWTWRSAIL